MKKFSIEPRRVAYYGVMLALALVLSWLERLIPFDFGIPGIKAGLTNIVVVVLLYRDGPMPALFLNLGRLALATFMFGTGVSFLYGLAGGVLSFAIMAILKRSGKFGIPGVSVAGGIAHNVGQTLVAWWILGSGAVLGYLPYLLLSGALAGAVVGAASAALISALAKSRV